jgi:hypothetical protein
LDSLTRTSFRSLNVYRHSDGVIDKGIQAGDEKVEQLATDFAHRVPEYEFSPAAILSFLLENRQFPHATVNDIDNQNQGGEEDSKESRFLGGADCLNLRRNSSLT